MDLIIPSITEGYMYSTIMDKMKGGSGFTGGMPVLDILKMSDKQSGGGEGFKALSDYSVPIGLVNIDYQYMHSLKMPPTCNREYSVVDDNMYDNLIGLVSPNRPKNSSKKIAKTQPAKKTLKHISIKK